jgi:hypothetical protein
MACTNFKLSCGHSVYGVCGCHEIEKIAAEMVETSVVTLTAESLKPFLFRAFQHGATLQKGICDENIAKGKPPPCNHQF